MHDREVSRGRTSRPVPDAALCPFRSRALSRCASSAISTPAAVSGTWGPATKDFVPCSTGQLAGILVAMYSDGPAPQHLCRDECLQLMACVSMGRIIYTRQALPAVELVNFALDHGDIVISTDGDGKLAAATRHAVVAFEADCLDAQQSGWSVTAIGPSREVTDPEDIGRLRKIGLSSWTYGTRERFIRVSPELLNGRRLRSHGLQDGDGADRF
jgi:uncharacterized protein